MKIIFDYNRTLYDPDANALYPGVLSLLNDLARSSELILVSKKVPGRDSRLDELGLRPLFTQVVFTEKKTIALFTELIGDASNVVVVGDRAQGEVALGNQLGCTTVWLRQGKFSQELPYRGLQPTFTISSIAELQALLKKL